MFIKWIVQLKVLVPGNESNRVFRPAFASDFVIRFCPSIHTEGLNYSLDYSPANVRSIPELFFSINTCSMTSSPNDPRNLHRFGMLKLYRNARRNIIHVKLYDRTYVHVN